MAQEPTTGASGARTSRGRSRPLSPGAQIHQQRGVLEISRRPDEQDETVLARLTALQERFAAAEETTLLVLGGWHDDQVDQYMPDPHCCFMDTTARENQIRDGQVKFSRAHKAINPLNRFRRELYITVWPDPRRLDLWPHQNPMGHVQLAFSWGSA
eukprot:scaffold3179_cov179-Pinguiococcus_pyrenoidosus.AAC.1